MRDMMPVRPKSIFPSTQMTAENVRQFMSQRTEILSLGMPLVQNDQENRGSGR
jgi:hypothetical protein